jgi:type II secretory pathway pseudopilin PulG
MRSGERGFGYLGLLILLALLGAQLAAAGTQWSTAARRERERELAFRLQEFRRAIAAYSAAREPRELPPSLQELLEDRRSSPPRHHLRRLYADPLTSRTDWVLQTDEQGRVRGVYSRAAASAAQQ